MFRSGFAFQSWQTPHAQEKCNAWAEARDAAKFAELIDLYWDGQPKDIPYIKPDQVARCGSASEMVGCQFPGGQKILVLERETARHVISHKFTPENVSGRCASCRVQD